MLSGYGLISTDSKYDPMVIPCKFSNKSLGFVWGGQFLYQLSPSQEELGFL